MLFQQRSHPTWYHHLLTRLGALTLLGLTLLLAACGGSSSTATTGGATGTTCPSTKSLTGAGSTFDYPLFSRD